ncbi:MAG: zinc-ribbon domain-containing protein [Butyrivibrio sp.]|nr:zinc-ribbon domain-containing protein [Butyrivibrio sp.]
MKQCTNCGTMLEDDAVFCGNCGAKMDAKPYMADNSQLGMDEPENRVNEAAGAMNAAASQALGGDAQNNYQQAQNNNQSNYYQQSANNGGNNFNNGYQQYQGDFQKNYQQNPYMQQNMDLLNEPVSVKEWLLTMLLLMIPVANIILIFVWAFSNSEKKSKSNFFKASLIWSLIWIAICVVLIILIGAIGISALYY